MIRVLAILLLATAGLLRIPSPTVGQHGDCMHPACAPAAPVSVSCCETGPITEPECPMSRGPCQCGVSPVPDPHPVPDAPLPNSGRDSLVAAPTLPTGLVPIIEPEAEPARGSMASVSLLARLTHNEIQALLGIWRM